MKKVLIISAVVLVVPLVAFAGTLPDTGQTKCYDNTQEITCQNQCVVYFPDNNSETIFS